MLFLPTQTGDGGGGGDEAISVFSKTWKPPKVLHLLSVCEFTSVDCFWLDYEGKHKAFLTGSNHSADPITASEKESCERHCTEILTEDDDIGALCNHRSIHCVTGVGLM